MFSHQAVVSVNLSDYLGYYYTQKYGKSDIPIKKREDIPYDLKNIYLSLRKKGQCFGFSVIHGAMDHLKKLPRWEFILECIERWDPDAEMHLLNEKLVNTRFPEYFSSKLSEVEKEILLNTKLDDLFFEAANYIVCHHGAITSPFKPDNLSQFTLLLPEEEAKQNFWLVDGDSNILTIKDRQIPVIGRLDVEEISEALKDFNVDDQPICLVINTDHVIRVGNHAGKWFVYDPEYKRNDSVPNEDGYKYLKYFPDKQSAILEVLRIQKSDILIEMASTKCAVIPSKILTTDNEISEFIKKNLSPTTFILLATYRSDILMQLIIFLVKQNDPNSDESRLFKVNFASSLLTKDDAGNTGLHVLAKYAPLVLSEILKLSDGTHVGQLIKANLASALLEKGNNNWTALHTVARYAPLALTQLIKYMVNDYSAEAQFIKENFAKALLKKTDMMDSTALHFIAQYSPESLMILIDYMEQDHSPEAQFIKENFAKALLKKTFTGETGFNVIAQYAPLALIRLFKYMEKDYSRVGLFIKENFAKALIKKDMNGWTGLHMIAHYGRGENFDVLKILMTYIEKDYSPLSQDIKLSLLTALEKTSNDGFTGLSMIPMYDPCNVRLLIKCASQYAHHLVPELIRRIKDNIELLNASCDLPNGLSLREQLIADVYISTFHDWMEPEIGQFIFNELGTGLTDLMIDRIVNSFVNVRTNRAVKDWIQKSLLNKNNTIDFMQISPVYQFRFFNSPNNNSSFENSSEQINSESELNPAILKQQSPKS